MEHVNKLVIDGLANLLANTYVLAVKTQNYHWHVSGPNFHALHLMFESQYNTLTAAQDDIAERLRALNQTAPASLTEFLQITDLKEGYKVANANDMLMALYEDHQTVISKAKHLIAEAVKAGDDETADLVIGRVQEHQKTSWMLRSSL